MVEQNKGEGEEISPDVRAVLEAEAHEAEVQAAMDAAAEEGRIITREEAKQILQQDNPPTP
ncbi:MAG: hypothetical protein HYW45_03135 [Candidatus Daviesbacteria bacterium]|nr:MAG: hypothetical protein HYW45_03135 [Candidatus Daviesbacteria bacterium]